MSYGENNGGLSAAEYVALSGNNGNNRNGVFGDDLLGLIVLLAVLGGFGGFGGFGGGAFGGGGRCGAPCATQADVRAAVDQQTLISKLDQQTYGLADSTYALNNAITNGFHGVDNAICNLGYNIQSGFNTIGHQISDCCCTTQRAIDGVNFNMAKGFCDLGNVIQSTTRDIIDNQNCNTRAIMDFMVSEKLASKDARIAELTNQLGRAEQNSFTRATVEAGIAEVLRRTGHDCPTAAYIVQPPTPLSFPTNCCGQVQFGGNCGGCGGY